MIDLNQLWCKRGRSTIAANQVSLEATHERLFVGTAKLTSDFTDRRFKMNLGRTEKLRNEDMRGKKFNIINGQYEGHDKWLGPLTTLKREREQLYST